MRIEVTPNSVDVLASKEGAISLAVGAASFVLLFAIVGSTASLLITAVAVVLVLPVAWWQRRTPASRGPADTNVTASTIGQTSH
jgi:hypothetical protein